MANASTNASLRLGFTSFALVYYTASLPLGCTIITLIIIHYYETFFSPSILCFHFKAAWSYDQFLGVRPHDVFHSSHHHTLSTMVVEFSLQLVSASLSCLNILSKFLNGFVGTLPPQQNTVNRLPISCAPSPHLLAGHSLDVNTLNSPARPPEERGAVVG